MIKSVQIIQRIFRGYIARKRMIPIRQAACEELIRRNNEISISLYIHSFLDNHFQYKESQNGSRDDTAEVAIDYSRKDMLNISAIKDIQNNSQVFSIIQRYSEDSFDSIVLLDDLSISTMKCIDLVGPPPNCYKLY